MKQLLFLTLLCTACQLSAQPGFIRKLPSLRTAPLIKSDIEKVVRDITQGLDNVRGDTILQSANSVTFYSKIIPAGARDCFVTVYGYPHSPIWQATMFEGDDFEEAAAKYKGYFRQLAGTYIALYDRTSYKLTGEYDVPDEGRAFASSILQFADAGKQVSRLSVEVGLNYSFPVWKVSMLVYEKAADEDLRPTLQLTSY